jgi:putative mRNA 3-end processing factor
VSHWRWSGGVHVKGTRLWCDAARAHGVTFVSGADVSLRRRCERIVTTPRTQKLAPRLDEVLPAPFGRPFALGRARLELLPAGRLPGSAQLRVEMDGRALLYAGAVHPSGRLAEPAQVRGCDELVIDVAGGPLREEQLLEAARSGAVTVGSVFRAAEAAACLEAAGMAVQTSRPLAALLSRYRRMGVAVPSLAREGVRIAWKGGAGPGVDIGRLVEFAAATGARLVHVVGGFSDDTARAFARKRLRASPLGPPQQVPLFS